MKSCSECRERLGEYMDQMLDENEASEIKAHLLSCDACAETLAKLRAAARALGELNVEPPAEFSIKWRAMVRAEAQNAKRRWMTMRQMGLVAAALVVALSAWSVWPAINGANLNGAQNMERTMEAPAPQDIPEASLKMAAGAALESASAAPQMETASLESVDAQDASSESPAAKMPDTAAQDTRIAESEPAQEPAPAEPAPAAGDSVNASDAPMSLAEPPAEGTEIPIGIIHFEFSSIDVAAANAIVVEAFSRTSLQAAARDGAFFLPPMTAQGCNPLYAAVRAICTERNVSEVLITGTPNDELPDATQVFVTVK